MIKSYDRMTAGELEILVRLQDRIINSLIREIKRVKAFKCKHGREAKRRAALKRWEGVTPEERKAFASQGGKARAARIKVIKQAQAVITNGTSNGTTPPDRAH